MNTTQQVSRLARRDPASVAKPRSWYGGYFLIDSIGRGGMAEVFRAVKPGEVGFLRTVALKRVSASHANSESFVQMFCEEARISAMLSHPNIVQVYEFGKAEGSYFLAMEYLRGKDLLSTLRSTHARNLTNAPAVVALIGQKVAAGLSYVHELRGNDGQPLNLVHRDISPANIMLLKQGGVKILDFGIAKSPALARQETQAGFVKGKFSYISPEQARGEPLDGRSDIFSLGVTLWESLTGERLFRGINDFETIRNVLNQPIERPSLRAPWVPAQLDRIVMRALQRDRTNRYASARLMASDLNEFLRKHPANDEDLAKFVCDIFGAHSSQVIPIVRDEFLSRAAAEGSASGPHPSALEAHPPSDAPPATDAPAAASSRNVALATPDAPGMTAVAQAPPMVRGTRKGTVLAAAVVCVAFLASAKWLLPLMSSGQPAQRAVTETVKLEIESSPPGADLVDADGKTLGITPLTIERARAQAAPVLQLRKRGYQTLHTAPSAAADAYLVVTLVPASDR